MKDGDMKKKLPQLKSDKEAEAFVGHANLTEYDLSGLKKMQFDFDIQQQVLPVVDAMKRNPGRGIPARKVLPPFERTTLRRQTRSKGSYSAAAFVCSARAARAVSAIAASFFCCSPLPPGWIMPALISSLAASSTEMPSSITSRRNT